LNDKIKGETIFYIKLAFSLFTGQGPANKLATLFEKLSSTRQVVIVIKSPFRMNQNAFCAGLVYI
jgi:hypothetical protein